MMNIKQWSITLLVLSGHLCFTQQAKLVFEGEDLQHTVIHVFPANNSSDFNLYVDHENNDYSVPVQVKHFLIEDTLVLQPLFPLTSGVTYILLGDDFEKKLKMPRSLKPPTSVIDIYPKTFAIPSNTLRFYIYFSGPMREGDFLSYLSLTNEHGEEIEHVFFDNQYELWNKDRTRLTIIVDPGRVKTGLLANQEMGVAFEEGMRYTLTVKKDWRDIYGNALKSGFSKKYTIVKRDSIPPNPLLWEVSDPLPNSKNQLEIRFNDTLDHVSSSHFISILFDSDQLVNGAIEKTNENKFSFIPSQPWKKGTYTILINSRIEDLAGNNINGLFDHQIGSLKSQKEGELVTLNFTIE